MTGTEAVARVEAEADGHAGMIISGSFMDASALGGGWMGLATYDLWPGS
ncbi:MAG: hypothetical protein IFK93_12460 [Acidobacteria bacterium]|nr:hypothetical protein [Candidatus Sulfomarinibacter kjeldsenii]